MDNVFITQYFDWAPMEPSKKVRFINSILRKLGFWCRLAPPPSSGLMTNVEQRMNMFHLVSQVLVYNVPGDLVELGCHNGQSAVLIQKVVMHYDPSRKLHVYDSFEGLPELHEKDGDTPFRTGSLKPEKEQLIKNFQMYDLPVPEIHEGWFRDTLPDQLPDSICFAHLDGDLYDSILVSLIHVYPKLSKGAICLIDDYADPDVLDSWNRLPGVKCACDEFLADKPETVSVLYCGHYAHGYFRKQ